MADQLVRGAVLVIQIAPALNALKIWPVFVLMANQRLPFVEQAIL